MKTGSVRSKSSRHPHIAGRAGLSALVLMLVLGAAGCSEKSDPLTGAVKEPPAGRLDPARIQSLARAGDPGAQYALGMRYATGDGDVPQDDNQARHWMHLAAEQGHQQAQYELGSYYTLAGPTQDYEQAIIWLRRSAEQGYPPAQLNLGMLFAVGRGVAPDFAEALAWIMAAEAGGDPLAQEAKAQLLAVMTEQERDQAERRYAVYRQQSIDAPTAK